MPHKLVPPVHPPTPDWVSPWAANLPPENMLKLAGAVPSQHRPPSSVGSQAFCTGVHPSHPIMALTAFVTFTDTMTNHMNHDSRLPLVSRSIVIAKEVLLHEEAVMLKVEATL